MSFVEFISKDCEALWRSAGVRYVYASEAKEAFLGAAAGILNRSGGGKGERAASW